jgi:hypothetical protein
LSGGIPYRIFPDLPAQTPTPPVAMTTDESWREQSSAPDQAAFDFATCVAIASIKAGDRQS